MVKRLVELHGGGMMARSQAGQGSVFTVWLPWRQAAGGAPAFAAFTPHPDVVPAVPAAPLVLVIEDDPVAAELTQMQLAAAGYPSVVEPDATRGMARAIARLPTHIVLDIGLPDVNGWELLAQLQDHEATRHIPVVIVSCTQHPQRGFALGAAQVLVKPVKQADLAAALAAAVPDIGAGHGRVLVIDDDTKTLGLVCQHLSAAGYGAVGALGGQQGLEAVSQRRPDVIVLDLVLSKVSGGGLLTALAHEPETAAIPIIVLSAKALSAAQCELLHGRVHSVMDKADFAPASIVAEVGRMLARKRQLEAM
jgi:DNA-binding response OmpR family regulator